MQGAVRRRFVFLDLAKPIDKSAVLVLELAKSSRSARGGFQSMKSKVFFFKFVTITVKVVKVYLV